MHRPSLRTCSVALAAVASLGLGACGDDDSSTATQDPTTSAPADGGSEGTGSGSTSTDTVEIVDFTFMPAELTAAPGTEITVVNMDSTAHTFTGEDDNFDTGNIEADAEATFTAPEDAGEYPYICTIHSYMTGMLTVE